MSSFEGRAIVPRVIGCITCEFSAFSTSAPRSPSRSVANGPAQTTQRSMTLSPSSGSRGLAEGAVRSSATGATLSSERISALCSLSSGAGRRRDHGVFGMVNGRPGISISPSAWWLTFVQNPRSRKCESAAISATSNSGPQSTFALRAAAQISRLVWSLSQVKK